MTTELPVSGQIRKAFVDLADTLVADFDIIEFLDLLCQYSTDLLRVTASGILLADLAGQLDLVAASSERARAVEQFQLQYAEGPCLDSYHTRTPVSCPDLDAATGRWPDFAPAALEAGFAAVHALPMRTIRRHEIVTGQLQTALNSRIVIEQAKGVLAERLEVGIDEAFAALGRYARDHNLRLAEVARSVTEGSLDILPADSA